MSDDSVFFDDVSDGVRFEPGQVLADRYRIVTLIGRGGMGEVYRADDLVLETSVALKFLPVYYSSDSVAYERLRAEVRLARQISHRNVCRVFDIAEADGHRFLAMEHVDGEDLATLLKRIGRLPGDKAVEAARQICAGLAAVHEQGVVHRDLKPANVMIDGRGNARLMDFGVAQATDRKGPDDRVAGTPAYMAPEQLAGHEASKQSDIYALGLVLYELFTGRRAAAAESLHALEALHASRATPTPPSAILGDIDPAAERVILSCLEVDPAERPASALAVMSALPGGDPLAAVLEAGETPSPELVAASGQSGALPVPRIRLLLALGLVCLAANLWLRARHEIDEHAPLSQEVLDHQGRQNLAALGYPEPRDSGGGFFLRGADFAAFTEMSRDGRRQRLADASAPWLRYWYRESPDLMVTRDTPLPAVTPRGGGALRPQDPPLDRPGMVLIATSARGRLLSLDAVPGGKPVDEVEPDPTGAKILAATGATPSDYREVEPYTLPPREWDSRRAWIRKDSERGPWPHRLEAAFVAGRPTWVRTWDDDSPPRLARASSPEPGNPMGWLFWNLFIFLGGALLAWRNLGTGRGDRTGAARLAIAAFTLCFVSSFVRAHHTPSVGNVSARIFATAAYASLRTLMLVIMYIALEPFVRRILPTSLVSWTRLWAGRWRDPAVGRDLLMGAVVMLAAQAVIATILLLAGLGDVSFALEGLVIHWDVLKLEEVLSNVLRVPVLSASSGLGFLFVLVLVRAAVGNRRFVTGSIDFAVIFAILLTTSGTDFPGELRPFISLTLASALYFLVRRHGLLAITAAISMHGILNRLVGTIDSDSWLFGNTATVMVVIAAMLLFAAKTTAAGAPLLGAHEAPRDAVP